MIKCDQKDCHFYEHVTGEKKEFFMPGGFCTADNVVLAEAPGGFWLVCRTKMGHNWIPDEPKKLEHVCGLQGFGIGSEGWYDICPACEEDKKERGF